MSTTALRRLSKATLVATTMMTAAFTTDFDALYPISVLTTAAALLHYRGSYPIRHGR